jgi:hypothetical protein
MIEQNPHVRLFFLRVSLQSPQCISSSPLILVFCVLVSDFQLGLYYPVCRLRRKHFLRDVVYSRNPRDTLPSHDKTWKVYECRKCTWKSLNVRVFMSWFFLRESSENEESVIGS